MTQSIVVETSVGDEGLLNLEQDEMLRKKLRERKPQLQTSSRIETLPAHRDGERVPHRPRELYSGHLQQDKTPRGAEAGRGAPARVAKGRRRGGDG